jgi:predicted RecA/RadA family phage recombinase
MTTTFIQPGNVVEKAAPAGGITAGQGMLYGVSGFGIALNTAAATFPVQLATTGIFTIAKTSALVISDGDRLFWDNTNKVVNKTSTAQTCVGIAESSAVNPSPTVLIRLTAATPAGT